MSQQTVGITIERLLTDEEFRLRFTMYPLDTVADLHLEGVELTPDEVRAFVQADLSTWSGTASLVAARHH
jgi:hypothetical protein